MRRLQNRVFSIRFQEIGKLSNDDVKQVTLHLRSHPSYRMTTAILGYISMTFDIQPTFKLLLQLRSGLAYKIDLVRRVRYSVAWCGVARRGAASCAMAWRDYPNQQMC